MGELKRVRTDSLDSLSSFSTDGVSVCSDVSCCAREKFVGQVVLKSEVSTGHADSVDCITVRQVPNKEPICAHCVELRLERERARDEGLLRQAVLNIEREWKGKIMKQMTQQTKQTLRTWGDIDENKVNGITIAKMLKQLTVSQRATVYAQIGIADSAVMSATLCALSKIKQGFVQEAHPTKTLSGASPTVTYMLVRLEECYPSLSNTETAAVRKAINWLGTARGKKPLLKALATADTVV